MAISFGLHDPGRPTDFLRDLGEAAQFKHNMAAMQRAEAQRAAMQGAVRPDGSIDMQALRQAYIAGGNIEGALEFDRNSAQTIKAQQEVARTNFKTLAPIVAGVTDEASYQRARIVAGRMGLDVSHMPPNYTPEAVAEAKMTLDALREPSTAQPYRWEANSGDLMQLGPDGKPMLVFDDPTPRYVPDGRGGMQAIPGTGAGGMTTVPPIGAVVPDPRKQGGPTQPASGNFLASGL